jgi:signal peptidase I
MFKALPRFRNSFLTHFRAFPLRAHVLTLIGLLTWLPVLSTFHSCVATLMFVTGPSMYPLLNTDYYRTTRKDVVLVDMWNPSDGLKRGMVVSFW